MSERRRTGDTGGIGGTGGTDSPLGFSSAGFVYLREDLPGSAMLTKNTAKSRFTEVFALLEKTDEVAVQTNEQALARSNRRKTAETWCILNAPLAGICPRSMPYFVQ